MIHEEVKNSVSLIFGWFLFGKSVILLRFSSWFRKHFEEGKVRDFSRSYLIIGHIRMGFFIGEVRFLGFNFIWMNISDPKNARDMILLGPILQGSYPQPFHSGIKNIWRIRNGSWRVRNTNSGGQRTNPGLSIWNKPITLRQDTIILSWFSMVCIDSVLNMRGKKFNSGDCISVLLTSVLQRVKLNFRNFCKILCITCDEESITIYVRFFQIGYSGQKAPPNGLDLLHIGLKFLDYRPFYGSVFWFYYCKNNHKLLCQWWLIFIIVNKIRFFYGMLASWLYGEFLMDFSWNIVVLLIQLWILLMSRTYLSRRWFSDKSEFDLDSDLTVFTVEYYGGFYGRDLGSGLLETEQREDPISDLVKIRSLRMDMEMEKGSEWIYGESNLRRINDFWGGKISTCGDFRRIIKVSLLVILADLAMFWGKILDCDLWVKRFECLGCNSTGLDSIYIDLVYYYLMNMIWLNQGNRSNVHTYMFLGLRSSLRYMGNYIVVVKLLELLISDFAVNRLISYMSFKFGLTYGRKRSVYMLCSRSSFVGFVRRVDDADANLDTRPFSVLYSATHSCFFRYWDIEKRQTINLWIHCLWFLSGDYNGNRWCRMFGKHNRSSSQGVFKGLWVMRTRYCDCDWDQILVLFGKHFGVWRDVSGAKENEEKRIMWTYIYDQHKGTVTVLRSGKFLNYGGLSFWNGLKRNGVQQMKSIRLSLPTILDLWARKNTDNVIIFIHLTI